VAKPLLGESIPKRVTCTVTVDLSRFVGEIRAEWEALREHDILFLACIENPQPEATSDLAAYEGERRDMAQGLKPQKKKNTANREEEEAATFRVKYGVRHIRGGEIFEVRDEEGVILNDLSKPDERRSRSGHKRRIRMYLDPAQYHSDIADGINCYENVNLVIRRKPKENNFKAVLETIRDLMNNAVVGRAIPQWLHDIFLGYGSPSAAHYR